MPVRVEIEEGGWLLPLPRAALGKALQAMLEAAGAGGQLLELYVVRDGRMAEENLIHMGCSGPTNVLSFPAENPEEDVLPGGLHSGAHSGLSCTMPAAETMPGTLLLSVDTLLRECLLYGQDKEAHTLRLLAHGLGHVLGHDHGPVMDALCARMWVAGGAACQLALARERY